MKYIAEIKKFFKSKKAKPLKWILYTIGGFVLSVLVLLLAIYLLLKSGSLTEKAVLNAKPYLEPLGVEILNLDTLRIDVSNSLVVKNLQLNWLDSKMGTVKLSLGELDLKYSLDEIFDDKLTISQFSLNDISIEGVLKLEESSPVSEEETSEPINFTEIEELLQSPPLILIADDIVLKNIDIDLSVEQAGIKASIDHRINFLKAQVLFDANNISGRYAFELEDSEANVGAELFLDEVKTQVNLNPTAKFNGRWSITNGNNRWNIQELKLFNDIQLDIITIDQLIGGLDKQVFSTKNIALNTVTDIRGNDTDQAGLLALFPLSVDNRLKLGVDKLHPNDFSLDDMQVSLWLDNALEINSAIKISSDFMPVEEFILDVKHKLGVKGVNYKTSVDSVSLDRLVADISLLLNGVRKVSETALSLEAGIKLDSAPVSYVSNDKKAKTKLEARLTPNFNLDAKVKTALSDTFDGDVNELLSATRFNFKPNVNIQDLKLRENAKSLVSLGSAKVDLDLASDTKNIQVDMQSKVNAVKLDGFAREFSNTTSFKVGSDIAYRNIDLNLNTKIDRQQLLSSNIVINNDLNKLGVNYDFTIDMPQSLKTLMPDLKDVFDIGVYQVGLNGKLALKHSQKTALDVDFSQPEKLNVNFAGKLRVRPIKIPANALVQMKGPLSIDYDLTQDKSYKLDVSLKSKGIKSEPLLDFIPIHLKTNTTLDWPLTRVAASGSLMVEEESWLNYSINADNKNKQLLSSGKLALQAKPQWKKYLVEFNELSELGDIAINLDYKLNLKHDKSGVLELDPETYENYRLDMSLNTAIAQANAPKVALVRLVKPVSILNKINWKKDEATLRLDYKLPHVVVPDLAKVSLDGRVAIRADDGLEPDSIKLKYRMNKASIDMAGVFGDGYTDLGNLVTPMDLNLDVKGVAGNKITLNTLSFAASGETILFNATGNASIDGKNAEFESILEFKPTADMLKGDEITGAGSFSLPLSVTLLNAEQMSLSGAMKFDNFSVGTNDFNISELDGQLSYEEELKLDGEKISFAYLMQADPFQRVDFGRIQPFVDAPSLTIKNIKAGDISAGPLLANISLRQNLFRLQQFDVKLFDGHVAGQFYLDTKPGAWKVGVLSRMTGVDLRQMFRNSPYIQATSHSPVNMRMAFEFDVHEKLVEGRIDISKIERDQLLQLLEIIDPDHIDPQLASLRSALGLAHPEQVNIEMLQGLMNLQVSISALPKPVRITGIPLSAFIQQFSEDILALEAQFPVQ